MLVPPVRTLASSLPVAVRQAPDATVPVRVRFSTLAPRVQERVDWTRSVPSLVSSVTTSPAESTE